MAINPGSIPRVGDTDYAQNRVVCKGNPRYMENGRIIDGSLSRDPLNTGDVQYLRTGLLMGRITASKKYRPAIIGVLTSAYSKTGSSNTDLTVSVATATEVARLGSTGTLYVVGPPTAGGTVAVQTATYSAVNTSTGVITITALSADAISGSFVCPTDGAHVPKALVDSTGGPLKVTDKDEDDIDIEFRHPLIGGDLDSSQIINWPSNTVLQTWLRDQLQETGLFTFDDVY